MSTAGKALVLTLLAGLGLGCGDSTGPSANVTGAWGFSASNLSGGGVSCSIGGMTLSLTQSGQAFSGAHGGGTLSCSGPGGTLSDAFGGGSIVNGSVTSSGTVAFDVETSDFHCTGTIVGNSMSGTATIRFDLGAPTGVLTLVGNWAAARR